MTTPSSSSTAEKAGVAPGLTTERVGFFTDAVFAIAITLLVIDIPRPEGDAEFTVGDGVSKLEASRHLLSFVFDQWGSFYAYLIAFLLMWIVWREHHELFDQIYRMSPALTGWHFPLLLVLGFTPYAVGVYGHNAGNPAAAVFFTIVVGFLLLVRTLMQAQAKRDGLLRPEVDTATFHRGLVSSWAVTVYWFATLTLAWWTPWTAIAHVATWLVPAVVARLQRRSAEATSA